VFANTEQVLNHENPHNKHTVRTVFHDCRLTQK